MWASAVHEHAVAAAGGGEFFNAIVHSVAVWRATVARYVPDLESKAYQRPTRTKFDYNTYAVCIHIYVCACAHVPM